MFTCAVHILVRVRGLRTERTDGLRTLHRREKPDADPVEVRERYDFVFGCDGAFSAVRREMERSRRRFSSNVHFIDHCYIELTLPAAGDSSSDAAADAAHSADATTRREGMGAAQRGSQALATKLSNESTLAYREELALTGGRLPASRVRACARDRVLRWCFQTLRLPVSLLVIKAVPTRVRPRYLSVRNCDFSQGLC